MTIPDREESNDDAVSLPNGRLIGVRFSGMPARVTEVRPQSPVADQISSGQIVRRVVVPGRVDLTGLMSGRQVEAILQKYSEGRRLLYMTEEVSRAARQCRMVLTLEAGAIGVNFSGTPAIITGVRSDSPFVGILRPGLEVEGLQIGDEYETTELMASDHLGAMLAQYIGRTDRVLLLRKRRSRPAVNQSRRGQSPDLETQVAPEQSAEDILGLSRNVWRQDYQSMASCRAATKPWERARLASHVFLAVTVLAMVVGIFSVCSSQEQGSNCYLVLMLPFLALFAMSVALINTSWSTRTVGHYCSKVQICANAVGLAVTITLLVVVDCGELDGDWCNAVPGLVSAYGAVFMVLVNIPSFFTKAMELDQFHDDWTEPETDDDGDNSSPQPEFELTIRRLSWTVE